MKQRHCCFLVVLISLFTMSCNRDPNIQVDVREVNFLNKTGNVIEGKLVKSEILGSTDIIVFDTLLMVTTSNPEGQLQVFSLNSLEYLGSFCKQGRARNEMSRAMFASEQVYYKNDHVILVLFEPPSTLKEVNVTASIQNGKTEIINSLETRIIANDGEVIFLGNNYDNNYRFEYERNIFGVNEVTDVPTRYTVYKDGKKRELKFFKTLINTESDKTLPYRGYLHKHPKKNLIVQSFQNMDYLLFMDFDADKYFAIHQRGSITFNDTYIHSKSKMTPHFTDAAKSSEYLMFLYRQGEYTQKTTADNFYPELLVFDWDGNYITGFKMDRKLNRIEYDEINKVLYGRNIEEELYAYDMENLIP